MLLFHDVEGVDMLKAFYFPSDTKLHTSLFITLNLYEDMACLSLPICLFFLGKLYDVGLFEYHCKFLFVSY